MVNLKELFHFFFKLGFIAFGGPAAHIAILHKEVVDSKKWLSQERFLELLGLTSLIPGPNSTELVLHIGLEKKGIKGLCVSGLSFIIPACFLTWILSLIYLELQSVPAFKQYLIGVSAAAFILIAQALQKMRPKALSLKHHYASFMLFFVLHLFVGLSQVLSLVSTCLIVATFLMIYHSSLIQRKLELSSVFFIFLKVGSILFGSGYVLFAYLQEELVETSLLTQSQLMDAVAYGQFTPGPVLSTATFIGQILAGPKGAVLATLGIFLPSFVFVIILGKMQSTLSKPFFKNLVQSATAASLAMMLIALYSMIKENMNSPTLFISMAVLGLIIFIYKKLSSIQLVSLSIPIGVLVSFIHQNIFT